MGHVRKVLALLLVASVAHAQLYPKSPFPPTFPAYSFGCNNTSATAAPGQCKFADTSAAGNLSLVVGSYSPVTASGATTNKYNTVFGVGALNAVTNVAGTQGNTAFGYNALLSGTGVTQEDAFGKLALRDDVEGSFNTAIGSAAMRCFTGTGNKQGNVAVGHGAMGGDDTACSTTPGGYPGTYGGNTAIGAWSLQEMTTGTANTFVGDSAGLDITTGATNVGIGFYANCAPTTLETTAQDCAGVQQTIGIGYHALRFNSANANIGIGYEALGANTTGAQNVALGFQALANVTTDGSNTALGYDALLTQTGSSGLNTAVGANAGKVLLTGTNNTYVGANAGLTQSTTNNSTAIGQAALTLATGGTNTALGYHAGASVTTGNLNLILGTAVASTTCTSCAGNILIGLDSTTDTVASGTTHTLQIRGVSPGIATIAATGINTSTPTVTIGGAQVVSGGKITPTSTVGIVGTTGADSPAAGSVGEVASIHCVVGTAAAAATTITVTIATPAVVTWSSHTFVPSSGLANYSCPINFTTTGALPTGIVAGTNYYIIGSSVSGDTFQISDTIAHALAGTNAVATSGSQSGTQSAYIGNLGANGTVFNGAALSLVAGDWDCQALGEFQELTTLTSQRYAVGIATVGGAFGAIGTFTDNRTVSGAVGAFNQYLPSPIVQENISATTTVIAIVSANFTVGTQNNGGQLRCRRMR